MVVVDGEYPGGVQLAQSWEVDGGGRKGAVRGAVGMLLGLVLVVLELALVARMVLDWVGVVAVGGGRWSIPARRMAHAVTEPVLAPVRRVLPPVRLGSVSIDLAFTVVFILVLVLRTMVAAW
ncbi:MAG: YggT family protein [Pseudonocardiales bacterium]|nr:YggT family protein [Pseudonocardiales bacterium]